MPFDETGPAKIFCTACGTPHHEDCYQENGGCTVFGCARAPADDPKLQVSQNDLRAVSIPVQSYSPAPQPYVSAPVSTEPPARSAYGSSPLGLSQAAAPAPAPASTSPAAPPVSSNTQNSPPPPPGSPYQYAQPQYPGYPYTPSALAYGATQKSRTAYIVLGIFLGALGIHNFYGGYTGRAVGQLCLTVLTLGYLGIVSWIWAIIEICVVNKDSSGIPFS
jgi:TM2 domain-containing membrane protein YozV